MSYLNFGLPGSPTLGSYYTPLTVGADPGLGYSTALGSFGGSANTQGLPTISTMSAPPAPAISPAALPSFAPGTPNGNAVTDTLKAAGAGEEAPGFFGPNGFNLGSMKDIASILGGFGQLWSGFQANKLAKDALGFQKKAFETNLENQTASYNMALEDRIRSRYAQQGGTRAQADAYINDHRLEA